MKAMHPSRADELTSAAKLVRAAARGDLNSVQLQIEAGHVDVNGTNNVREGLTALHAAAHGNFALVLSYLVNHVCTPCLP